MEPRAVHTREVYGSRTEEHSDVDGCLVPAVTRKGAQRSLRQALVDVALKDCYVTRVEEQEFLLHMDKEITAIGKVSWHCTPERERERGILQAPTCLCRCSPATLG